AIAGELLPVPELGLTMRAIDRRIAGALGLKAGAGLLIDNVAPASLADRAGVKAGDVLIRVAGIALAKPGDLAFVLDNRGIGDLSLTVLRGGVEIPLRLNFMIQSAMIISDGANRSVAIIRAYDLGRLGLQMAEDGVTVEVISPASPTFMAGMD
ncbi:hypothetical protein CGU37_27955, partial [Pseudomonas fluorescens]